MPRLVVGPGGRGSGGADAFLDHLARNGAVRIIAHRVAALHAVIKRAGLGQHLLVGIIHPVRQVDRLVFDMHNNTAFTLHNNTANDTRNNTAIMR